MGYSLWYLNTYVFPLKYLTGKQVGSNALKFIKGQMKFDNKSETYLRYTVRYFRDKVFPKQDAILAKKILNELFLETTGAFQTLPVDLIFEELERIESEFIQ